MRLDTKYLLIDSFLCKQDKTFFLIKSIKIFCEGFTELQHSTSITKPQFSLQQHLAQQCDHFLKGHFIGKDIFAIYLYNGILITVVTHLGAVL